MNQRLHHILRSYIIIYPIFFTTAHSFIKEFHIWHSPSSYLFKQVEVWLKILLVIDWDPPQQCVTDLRACHHVMECYVPRLSTCCDVNTDAFCFESLDKINDELTVLLWAVC